MFKKNVRGITVLVMAAMLLVLLAACGSSSGNAEGNDKDDTKTEETNSGEGQNDNWPRTLKHEKGEITLEQKPQVASVDVPKITTNLALLGVKPIASEGWSSRESSPIFSKYTEGMDDVMDLGGHINNETLLQAGVDLILTSAEKVNRKHNYDKTKKIAPTAVIGYPENDRKRLKQIAKFVGKEKKAEQILKKFDQKIQKAKKAAKGHKGETVLFIRANGKDFTVLSTEQHSIYFDKVGLTPVKSLQERGQISLEGISKVNPEHIFIAPYRRAMDPENPDALINIWKDNPVWKQLKAVKNDHVYQVDTLVASPSLMGKFAGLKAVIENLGQGK